MEHKFFLCLWQVIRFASLEKSLFNVYLRKDLRGYVPDKKQELKGIELFDALDCVYDFELLAAPLLMGLILSIVFPSVDPSGAAAVPQHKKQVVITAMLDNLGNVIKWDDLLRPAVQELKFRHPDLDIQINYTTTPYNQTRIHLLNSLGNKSAIDLVSVDQIWLGDFAQRGYLANLTDYVKIWGRSSDWYQTNFDGGVYKGRVYGIWAWTDVRGMWYWKDLLNKAGVDPNSLKSWDGYIASARKINSILGPDGISGADPSWSELFSRSLVSLSVDARG